MYKSLLKHLALTTTFYALVSSAYAVAPGFYIGVMTGPATNDGSDQNVQTFGTGKTIASSRSQQWGSRLYIGYKFNLWASVEGGATIFSKINYNTKGVETCATPFVRVRDLEVMIKGNLPLAWFEIFAKAGVAYTYIQTSGAFNGPFNAPNQPPNQCGKNNYNSNFRPVAAVGLGYDLSQRFVVDLTWTRLFAGGIPGNIDFYALGISWHIVDIYCGQFLC